MRCTRWPLLLIFSLLASGLANQSLLASDWPQFLGPKRDGTSDETGLATRVPSNGFPVLWEKAVGKGYSAPSVQAGKLILFQREGEEESVSALDAGTGAPLWRYAYSSHYRDPYGYNNGPRAAPLISTNRVYTFGAEGRLICLNLSDGHLVWQRDTATDFLVPEAFFGVGSSPLIDDGRLYVMAGGQPNSGMVALDPGTGKTLWESTGQACWDGITTAGWRSERHYRWSGAEKLASYSSPIVATIQGRKLLLCFMRQGLAALNPTNGAVQFVRWFQSEANDSVNAMTPVVQGDDILISAAYYSMGSVLLHVKQEATNYSEVWHQPRNPGLRDPETGRAVEAVLGMHWSQPILIDGYLYGFTGRNEPDAYFRCVEWETGRKMWERDERWAPHSTEQPLVMGRGSLIYADHRLIALGEGGILAMYKPSPKGCEELGRWQVPSLQHPSWAGPVLSGRRLYLRSEDRLVCLDLAAK